MINKFEKIIAGLPGGLFLGMSFVELVSTAIQIILGVAMIFYYILLIKKLNKEKKDT